VSSYGQNTFTHGAPCLCLVRCPLDTSAAAMCRSAPHLRRRNSPRSRPGRVVPFGTFRPGRLQPRAEVHSTRGASGSSKPSAPKNNCPRFWHRRPAPLRWAAPAQQNSHNSSSIRVSVKPPLQNFPCIAEAAREPKPSARPDVDKASEGHFPRQEPLVSEGRPVPKMGRTYDQSSTGRKTGFGTPTDGPRWRGFE
jgi:hypothetical protein